VHCIPVDARPTHDTSTVSTDTSPILPSDARGRPPHELAGTEAGTSTTSGALPSSTEVVQSVARLLEAQRVMMEAQVQAMAAQSVPPLGKFSGEDFNTEEGSFDRWIEGFEDRAKITGWSEEQASSS